MTNNQASILCCCGRLAEFWAPCPTFLAAFCEGCLRARAESAVVVRGRTCALPSQRRPKDFYDVEHNVVESLQPGMEGFHVLDADTHYYCDQCSRSVRMENGTVVHVPDTVEFLAHRESMGRHLPDVYGKWNKMLPVKHTPVPIHYVHPKRLN